MKNLINKLGMVAILAALGIAGYVIVSHCMKSADNVKIQNKKCGTKHCGDNEFCYASSCEKKRGFGQHCGQNHECKTDHCVDGKCVDCVSTSDCKSGSCIEGKCL